MVLFAVASAPTLHGQAYAGAELGGAHVAQPTYPSRVAGTGRVTAGFDASHVSVTGSGAMTVPASERARMHGQIGGAVRTSATHWLGLEASGFTSVYSDGRFPEAVSLFGAVRGRVRTGPVELTAGAGAGALDDGYTTYPLTTIDVAAGTVWRRTRLSGIVTWHNTLGEPRMDLVSDPAAFALTVRDTVSYTDASVAAALVRGRMELDVRGGSRVVHETIAFEPKPGPRFFGSIAAAWWLTPRAALAVSTGRELADLARGLPAARYATVAMRLRLHAPGRNQRVAPTPPGAGPQLAEVLIERGVTGGATLRVRVPTGARRVEVAGTFSEWEPVELTADGSGTWSMRARLDSGPHRLMIRIDGGMWHAPANLPSLDDGIGGRVGVVTIP